MAGANWIDVAVGAMGSPHSAPGEAGAIQRVQVLSGQGCSEPPGNECCGRRGKAEFEACTVIVGVPPAALCFYMVGTPTLG